MPIIGGGSALDPRRAKHIDAINAAGYRCSIIDYGPENWCICRVVPAPSPADHATLVGDAQVFGIPQNIDAQIGANAATVTARLEAVNIPGDWVQSTTTWRQLLRRVAAYCQLMQRAAALSGNYVDRMFDAGRTLDSTIGDLPVNARQKLVNAADSFGFNRQGVNNNTTLRDALKQIAHQWIQRVGFIEDDL